LTMCTDQSTNFLKFQVTTIYIIYKLYTMYYILYTLDLFNFNNFDIYLLFSSGSMYLLFKIDSRFLVKLILDSKSFILSSSLFPKFIIYSIDGFFFPDKIWLLFVTLYWFLPVFLLYSIEMWCNRREDFDYKITGSEILSFGTI